MTMCDPCKGGMRIGMRCFPSGEYSATIGYRQNAKTNIMKPTRENIIEFICWLFNKRGVDAYLGEEVTIAEHMLQAAHFATLNDAPEPLIIAALLHDVGHFTNEFGDDYIEQGMDNLHEEAGSMVLSPFFLKTVTEPVRLHVAAKKYLCATDHMYYDALSDASKQTLKLQGGIMNSQSKKEFERNPYFASAVQLRRYDDAAKIPAMKVAGLNHYLDTLECVRKPH